MTRTTAGWRRALRAAPMVILASLSVQQEMAGAVVEVGKCVPNIVQFTTIQEAVNAAPTGSIIKICPANYPEQVVVNKNLTLTGVKSGTTDNPVLVIPWEVSCQTPRASPAVTPSRRRSWCKVLPPQSRSAISRSTAATTI